MFKVGDLVKTRIYSDVDGCEDCRVLPAGEAGLITEVCDFGTENNPIYSVTFPDNNVVPYYQSDLEVVSNA
jgi:hypothetical protein